ncbi:DUF2637 domain-containing protein [Prescottella agglutinans]|uniref:DUF2637 domain-containing protein n=1 Tax=Prescottella agglutinans TaxID=1644129 RepID=A0ABT6M4T6_9NOCA|nr:DUF2637 domain-containing protein [Prescottella agglutinans]MDH6279319.1 hypothetical protein [Prescottella agglutinans]
MKRNTDALASYGIAVLCFILSYSKLVDLAERAGYGDHMSKLWPLAVDGLAVMAARAVMRLSAGRGFAWALLIGGTVVSVLAAVLGAMVPPGPLPPLATAAVTIIPPLCLPLAAHLARKMLDAAPQGDAASEEAALETAVEIEVPQKPSAAPAASADAAALDEDAAAEEVPQEVEAAPAALVAVAAPQTEKPHLVREPQAAAVRQPQVRVVAAVSSTAEKKEKTAAPRAAPPARSAAARLADDPKLIADAVRIYAECGSFRAVGRQLGVDDRTVRRWRDDGLLAVS